MCSLFTFLMKLSDPQEQQKKNLWCVVCLFYFVCVLKDVNKKSGKLYFNVLISN